ncbi:MAG: hypothetical protein R2939_06360 [Kofleriaceae bacterium]
MNRQVVLVAALVVVAAAVGVLLWPRDRPAPAVAPEEPPATAIRRGPAPTLAPAESGSMPSALPVARPGTAPTSELAESTVTDHRTSAAPVPREDTVALDRPVDGVSPAVTGALHAALRPRVRACTAEIPAEARAVGAKVTAELTTSIHDGALRIDGATVSARDVDADRVPALIACVQQGLVGTTTSAEGEAARDGLALKVTYLVR